MPGGWGTCTKSHTYVCAKALQLGLTLCDPVGCRRLCPWDSPAENTEVGCRALLQEIFPTQGLDPMSPASPASQEDSVPASHRGGPESHRADQSQSTSTPRLTTRALPAGFSGGITASPAQRAWPPALISPCFFLLVFYLLVIFWLCLVSLLQVGFL